MCCARPVVGTDVGDVRRILEGFGIIVPPRDPEAMGNAVVNLLENEKLRLELGRKAREEILLKYRSDITINSIWNAYKMVV